MAKKHRKRGFFTVAAGCFLALVVLLFSALPGLAASEATQDVLNKLSHLQRVHIDPGWLPDIRTNQNAVQALLDSYLALDGEQRQELSVDDRTALRGYFEALYEVQGKDRNGVAALFEDATAAQDDPAAVPSAPPEDPGSSLPASVAESSAPASSPAPESVSLAVSSAATPAASEAEPGSLPAAVEPPQTPDGGGWLGFFGNRTLGTALLMILVLLAVLLFVRFLVALRKASKESDRQAPVDARAQEMFGENYDPIDDPVDEGFLAPPPADFLDTAPAPAPKAEPLFEEEPEAEEPKGDFSMFAPDNAPDKPKREGLFARRKQEKEKDPEPAPEEDVPETPDLPTAEEEKPGPTTSVFAPPGGPSRFDKAFGAVTAAYAREEEQDDEANRDALPKEAQHLFSSNPDRRNSITTRSFSAAPRTGRPKKMPFRQGDPDDLDAIDE